MKTILLAVDRDHSSDAARDAAIALARDLGASLEVMTVGDYLFDGDASPLEEAVADAVATAEDAGIPATPEIRYGSPAHEIVIRARELAADLIVVGAHRQGRIGQLIHGSISHDVATTARRPVLVVPEDAGDAADPEAASDA